METGFHATAKCAMPSLTNPNNLSIITGMPTSIHGVSGNYYLDKATGEEHMIVDDSTMRGSTILEQMADANVRVAAVTAKDKLRVRAMERFAVKFGNGISPLEAKNMKFLAANSEVPVPKIMPHLLSQKPTGPSSLWNISPAIICRSYYHLLHPLKRHPFAD